jgi:hypothetical protein
MASANASAANAIAALRSPRHYTHTRARAVNNADFAIRGRRKAALLAAFTYSFRGRGLRAGKGSWADCSALPPERTSKEAASTSKYGEDRDDDERSLSHTSSSEE